MRAVLPVNSRLVNQPQIGLVNERRRLERVVAALSTQIPRGARPQVSMDQTEEIIARLHVSACPRAQQECSRAGFVCDRHLIGPSRLWADEQVKSRQAVSQDIA